MLITDPASLRQTRTVQVPGDALALGGVGGKQPLTWLAMRANSRSTAQRLASQEFRPSRNSVVGLLRIISLSLSPRLPDPTPR